MQYETITPELHSELVKIAADYPDLVFENYGYQYLPVTVVQARAAQIARIDEILKAHIVGFCKFYNFHPPTATYPHLRLRFDYEWGAGGSGPHFTGAGYLPLDWLRDGRPEGVAQP